MASFPELFTGSDKTHGHWSPEAGYSTSEGPALEQDYREHLAGTRSLGLVPVKVDGMCSFGALDIDVDTIDHLALYNRVRSRNLSLNVCRSKSGGAHLYVFFKSPFKATLAQQLLRKWAGLLGYPNCEVFPKQTRIDDKNLGNWINLPYFGSDTSTRYCVGEGGALTLEEFLQSFKYYDENIKVDENDNGPSLDLIQIMPPCLARLTQSGLPEGVRNQGMFNFAVFYRKSHPNGWEDKLREHNEKYVNPKLTNRELESIIKSVRGKKYQYLCAQEPICSRCDRPTCETMKFGVSHMPWNEQGSFDDVTVSRLRKIDTKPPRYKLEVNGKDIELSTDELRNYQVGFKKKCFEDLNLILRPMKQEFWDQQLKELVTTIEVLEAPPDASHAGMVLIKVVEFMALSERSRKLEDVLKGLPYRDNGKVYFRSIDLQKYLQAGRFNVDSNILYQILLGEGAVFKSTRIKGKGVMLWIMPVADDSLQTEGFEEPHFEKVGEEL